MTWFGNDVGFKDGVKLDVAVVSSVEEDPLADQVSMLVKIHKQLRIMNIHLAIMTGEKITNGDIGE